MAARNACRCDETFCERCGYFVRRRQTIEEGMVWGAAIIAMAEAIRANDRRRQAIAWATPGPEEPEGPLAGAPLPDYEALWLELGRDDA